MHPQNTTIIYKYVIIFIIPNLTVSKHYNLLASLEGLMGNPIRMVMRTCCIKLIQS